jgi:tetratricopeptide (TPR) repeat protein
MNAKNSNEISILEKKVDQASTEIEKACAIADLAWSIKYSDPARAVELGDQAIELSLSIDLETILPKCYLSKAMGLLHMSRFKAAEKSAQMGLNGYKELNNQAGVRHALNVIGSIYFRWGNYASALEHYLESLEIHAQLSDTPDPGILSNIGAVYLQLGDTDRALDCYTQVKILADKVNGPADLKTATCVNMGEIYSRMGMYDDALEYLTEGYEICLRNDMKQAVAATTDDIGTVMMELGRYNEAMKNFREALTSFRALDDLKGEALVLSNMGKCCHAEGSGKAMEFYLDSLKRFRSLRDNQGIAEALIGISMVMLDLGRVDVALDKLGEAYEIAEKEGLKPQLSEIHKRLASILEGEEKFDTAFEHLKLYHEVENYLRSERVANRLRSLRVIHHVEQAREEVTKYILQNIELEKDKRKLEKILLSRAEPSEKETTGQEIPPEAGKQQERGIGSEPEFQMLIDRVFRIANDLNDVLSFAAEHAQQVFQDETLSEKTKKNLHLAVDSIRDAIPLTKQLVSLCNPEDDDKLKHETVSKYKVGNKVLVVEEDPAVSEQLLASLQEYGYIVLASTSLMNAREIISESINDIGCIIVDIVLDDGSGIDLIRDAHKRKPLLPILAGSSYPLSKSDLDYLKKDGISLVQKPYKIDNLLLKLSTILPL